MVDPPPLIRPVEGPVASPFSYDRGTPFRRGRRRVVRLAVPSGAAVRAPCAGRVTHAGRTPSGPAVTLRCGAWSVTLIGVAPAGAGRGGTTRAGRTLARARSTTIGLGVRRASDPFGYVDPLPLLRDPGRAPRFVPLGPAPRTRPVAPAPAPAPPARAPSAVPAPTSDPVPGGVPIPVPGGVPAPAPDGLPIPAPGSVPTPAPAAPFVAWVGLGLAALGLPAGAVAARLRRRSAAVRSTGRAAVRS